MVSLQLIARRILPSFIGNVYTMDIWTFTPRWTASGSWDSVKADRNATLHGISFDSARYVFLDPLARSEDASPGDEARQACIGITADFRLLYVVHLTREGDVLRIISAREAARLERERFEDD